MNPDEAAAIAEAEAEIARGERVPRETVQAFWRAHGLAHFPEIAPRIDAEGHRRLPIHRYPYVVF